MKHKNISTIANRHTRRIKNIAATLIALTDVAIILIKASQ